MMGKGDQVETGVFEVSEAAPEPTAVEIHRDAHYHELVEKGLTPHIVKTNSHFAGTGEQIWWDDNRNHFGWPMAVTLIGFMVFVLLVTQGVPW